MFPFEWVREPRWRRQAARVAAIEINPDIIQPALSVQRAWNKSRGILRGCREGGALIEDHIREVLDEAGRLVDVGETGRRIFGAEEMRAHVWTPEEHLAAYGRSHPEDSVVAWVGNGDLLSNPHFVAFEAAPEGGTLYHLSSETLYLSPSGRCYSSLVVRKPGCEPRVSIESVYFDSGEGIPQVYSADGQCITAEVECATYGQRLVHRGRAIDDEDIIRMAREGAFYDLRHLFLFGRVETGDNCWIDAGLAGFWDAEGRLDTAAVERALRGEPISADVRQFPAESVRSAMDAKGYDEASEPAAIGQYSLRDGLLRVVLRRGIYPHSMMGIRPDDRLISVALEGLSNRAGVTLRGAADIMKTLGAEEAILIDNGADVTMSIGGNVVLSSAEGRRNKLRSLILFRTKGRPRRLLDQDLRLIDHPPQYAATRGKP